MVTPASPLSLNKEDQGMLFIYIHGNYIHGKITLALDNETESMLNIYYKKERKQMATSMTIYASTYSTDRSSCSSTKRACSKLELYL